MAAASSVVAVQPVVDGSEALLHECALRPRARFPGSRPAHPVCSRPRSLFAFHGKVRRVAVVAGVGYVDFESSACTSSALMFDKTNFNGQTVQVALCDEAVAEDAWVAPGEMSAAAPPTPPPAPRAEPEDGTGYGSEGTQSYDESDSETFERVEHESASEPAPAAADAAGERARVERLAACVHFLRKDPINAPLALLGVTLASLVMMSTW